MEKATPPERFGRKGEVPPVPDPLQTLLTGILDDRSEDEEMRNLAGRILSILNAGEAHKDDAKLLEHLVGTLNAHLRARNAPEMKLE